MGVEGQEYLLNKKGKYICLVCPNKPKCGNLKQFKIHRSSKVHRARYMDWKKTTKAKLLFNNFKAPDIMLKRKKPNLDGEMPTAKRRKLVEDEIKQKRKQLLSVIKALPKFELKKVLTKISQVAPSGLRIKDDGKKALSIKNIKSSEALSELIMYCESFRSKDVSKLTRDQRALRDWQFTATILNDKSAPGGSRESTPTPSNSYRTWPESEENTPSPNYGPPTACWRRFVVQNNATLHDLTKITAKCFGWLAEDSGKAHGKFDWHRNTGKAVGMIFFNDNKTLQCQLRSKMSLQNHEVGNIFLVAGKDACTWKFGDHKVSIQFDGTSPGQDPLKRELPRCVGGFGPAPAYLKNIRNHWKSYWNDIECFKLNMELLGDRCFTDGFKITEEWNKSRSTALRRAAPVINPQGVVLQPWSKEEFMNQPFNEMDTQITWKWSFDVVTACPVLEERGNKESLLSVVPVDTEIIVDEFHHSAKSGTWFRTSKPFNGWCRLRNEKGVRCLMPRMGRAAVLPVPTD